MNKTRRDRTEITADMLRIAQDGARKTQLVYQANLNFRIIKRYLARLLDQGLLRHDPPRYYATQKGVMYLENFENLVRCM